MNKTLNFRNSLYWYHWLILSCSLLLTFTAWHLVADQQREKTWLQFDYQSNQIIQLVQERMGQYEEALLAGVAMIDATHDDIDFFRWKTFASALSIEERYPGINGIGVIYYIPPERLDGYLTEMRQLRPNYGIHPPHKQNEYWPITYIEPLASNKEAEGLDMAHETNRFSAAKKARDTNSSQITGPIILVQDKKRTPGFLFYAPFYKSGSAHTTMEEHREVFKGLVYAPFIMEKLMQGTLQNKQRLVHFNIRDGEGLLYNELTTAPKAMI